MRKMISILLFIMLSLAVYSSVFAANWTDGNNGNHISLGDNATSPVPNKA